MRPFYVVVVVVVVVVGIMFPCSIPIVPSNGIYF